MSTLTHPVGVLRLPDVPGAASAPASAKAAAPVTPEAREAPVGYRWVSRRWRVLEDGSRDYAAFHGRTAFTELLPVSSKLKAARR